MKIILMIEVEEKIFLKNKEIKVIQILNLILLIIIILDMEEMF